MLPVWTLLWIVAVLAPVTLPGVATAGTIVRSAVDAHGATSHRVQLHGMQSGPEDDLEGNDEEELRGDEWQEGNEVDELQSEDARVEEITDADSDDKLDEERTPPNWYCRRRAWCRTDSRRRGTETRVVESRRRLEGTDSRRREYYVKYVPAPTPLPNAYWQQAPQQQGYYPSMGDMPPPPLMPAGGDPFVYGAAPDWPMGR
mmetsp:Transcript_8315/g.14906  ORF Transcript_8315/g.14906 Transcript_8315/m.14906 type:complete len:202 (+) Transcript_8315:85-690(+)